MIKPLSNWSIIASHDWLRPIYDLPRKELVLNQVLHADETPYQILNRADGKPAVYSILIINRDAFEKLTSLL